MALRALLLRKQIDDKKKALEALRAKDAEFETRESELETSISKAESEEDKAAVESLVGEFEADKEAHEAAKNTLSGEIEQLEQDLAAEEEKAPNGENPKSAGASGSTPPADNNPKQGERKDMITVSMKTRGFLNMDIQRRDAFLARQDVKDFLQRIRELGKEKRAVTGAELTIPDVVLDLIRENISKYSKMIAHVNLKVVSGTARQNIMGTVPEAVWTEACAKLNELSLSFGQVEVDGYKVGGYIAICNATLEDSDLNLASEIMDAIGQAIGYAVDKAIIYGTGVKMPVGVLTRLKQTAKPSDWPSNAPAWKDLHTSNIVTVTGKTGKALFQQIVLTAGIAKTAYASGSITWVMNETTKNQLVAEGLEFNSAAAIVSGINNSMPVVGGDIVTLDFIPDGDIVFGYFALYLLAQRAGAKLAQSEHVRFIEDQTVFKGTARYDGMPVFGEAFGVMNIKGVAPATSATFAPDTANP